MGWLTDEKVEQWRLGKVPYLERVTSANLARLNFTLEILRKFALENQLKPSTKGKKSTLQFSKSGHPFMEKKYATHYVR